MFKKLALCLLLVLCVAHVGVIEVGAEGLVERVQGSTGNGVDDITKKISDTGASIYDASKEIALVGAVLALVVAGFMFKFFGGNSHVLQNAKSKIMWVFVGLFVTFGAIMIVATFLRWFGWDVG